MTSRVARARSRTERREGDKSPHKITKWDGSVAARRRLPLGPQCVLATCKKDSWNGQVEWKHGIDNAR
jgi:hypothetical protein